MATWAGDDFPTRDGRLRALAPAGQVKEFGPAQGGPDVGGQRTSIGAGLVVGGYVGGAAPQAPAVTDRPIRPAKRFGTAGQVLLTSALGLSGSWLTYAGSGSSQTGISVEPGVDYFVTDHVSLGVGAGGSYANGSGVDPKSGATVTSEQSEGWLEPRVGVDLPLGAVVSFYPRASLAFGYEVQDEKSNGAENKNTQNQVWVRVFAPLLIHPESHVFLGFGPTVSRDLSRTFTFPSGASAQNNGTTLGAGLLVGAWL